MPTDVLIGLGVAWLLTGLVSGVVMRRKGHDFFVWLALGSVLGPLVLPLAVDKARSDPAVESEAGTRHRVLEGGFDILIGVDASPEALAASRAALDMLRPLTTSVTVATVLDFEAKDSYTGKEDQAKARDLLDSVVAAIDYPEAKTQLLFGRPHVALAEYARQEGMELIVVGPRGHGAAETLFGSVTKNIVTGGEVPVLVGPRLADADQG